MTANDSDREVPAESDGSNDDSDAAEVDPFQIESRLTSHAIYVSEFEGTEESGYRLAYESMAADQGAVPHRELGRVVNVFLDLFGEDWTGTRIDATVCDLDGNPVATWHCEREWLADLANDEMTELEFSDLVVDSLEHVEE
jgi:hypothetical protein